MCSSTLGICVLAAIALSIATPAQRTLRTHPGSQPNEQLGTAIAQLGDIDADGTADFALATQTSTSISFAPFVQVRSGLDGHVIRVLTGLGRDAFGSSVAGIGDLDADGRDDILVGAPLTTRAQGSGEVRAYSGRTGGLIRSYSSPTLQHFGYTVAALGDVDNDGIDDFAAAATVSARVAIVSGRTGAVIRESFGGGEEFGRRGTVAAAGDIDRDGVTDYVVGDPVQSQSSFVRLYSGRTGQQVHVFSTTNQELIGTSVAGLDDVDGDGVLDYASGAPNADDPSTGVRKGAVFVFSGATGAVLRRIYAPRSTANNFGWAVSACDDLDGDGRGEIVAMARPGDAWLVSGATGTPLVEVLGGRSTNPIATRIHDVDGDGLREVLLGAPTYEGSTVNQGAGIVLSPRLLATATQVPTQCGGGPWLPQLGSTRPLLGQRVDIVGRDAPAGTTGVLFLASGHPRAVNLGVLGCDVHVDLGAAAELPLPPTSSWSLPLTIPAVPQLAGLRIALQAAYGPTNGPIGFDLSNGLLWFLGE